MKNLKKGLLMAALTVILSAGCESLKDSVTTDIDAENVKLEFTAVTESKKSETSSFSVTRTVNIAELSYEEIVEYAEKIDKVTVNSSGFSAEVTPAGSYTITNLTVTAEGVPGSLSVPSYTVGEAFAAPAGMNDYTALFIMKLIGEKSLTVTVSGETDAPAGTTVTISYESDLVFKVKVLK